MAVMIECMEATGRLEEEIYDDRRASFSVCLAGMSKRVSEVSTCRLWSGLLPEHTSTTAMKPLNVPFCAAKNMGQSWLNWTLFEGQLITRTAYGTRADGINSITWLYVLECICMLTMSNFLLHFQISNHLFYMRVCFFLEFSCVILLLITSIIILIIIINN